MIDTVLNLLFRCGHRRLTRPVTPARRGETNESGTYVVCLDCGKQFAYDLTEMRIGKAIDRHRDAGVLPPNMPRARKTKRDVALVAALPLAAVAGAWFKSRKSRATSPSDAGGSREDLTDGPK